jgi:hypothetical protein
LSKLRLGAYEPIKILFLPERLADAAQQLVGLTRGRPFELTHQLRERDMGTPKHMDVIRHDNTCMQAAEPTSSRRLQLASYQSGNVRLPQVEQSSSSIIQQSIQSDESLTRTEVLTKEGTATWQACSEPPTNKYGQSWSVPMRQPATMASHSHLVCWCRQRLK